MRKLEYEGRLLVFTQEGGFACPGIIIDDHDLGKEILGSEIESLEFAKARITVELDDEEGTPGDIGFFYQVGMNR